MRRPQLETALRAVAELTKEREFVLVGAQSVHAHTEAPPPEVLVSEECDLMAKGRLERLEAVASALGKNSAFHAANGFFVDPVEPSILVFPAGWESRLTAMHVGVVTAWCLEANDLVVSKLDAGRLKDYEFVSALLREGLAQFDEVVRRVRTFPDPPRQPVLLARLRICRESVP
jgi:hypothetical protein